jgi:hypothetical protein
MENFIATLVIDSIAAGRRRDCIEGIIPIAAV